MSPAADARTTEPTTILTELAAELDDLSPQVRRAAHYVLDNPGEIAVSSMRSLADAAGVKPNTLVRMARAVGFDGYDDFRNPFRHYAAEGALSFPDRARFLQTIGQGDSHNSLLADMAGAALANVESLFATIDTRELKAAADLLTGARRANVLGVGTARTLAENFAYIASMAFDNVAAIPVVGLAIDDVAKMNSADVLLAMTFSPYRVEIVDAVARATQGGVPVIAITDSHGSPIVAKASHAFIVPNDSPLPFSSNVAATALLETLLAFAVAEAPDDVAAAIDAFHANRRAASIYYS